MRWVALALGVGLASGSAWAGVGTLLAVGLATFVRAPQLWWGPVTLAVTAGAGLAVSNGVRPVLALVGVLVWLAVHRALVGERRDPVVHLVIALVLVCAGSVSQSPLFALALLCWLIDLPMHLGALRGGRALRTAGAIGLGATVLFWSLPRLGGALPPVEVGAGLTGFRDDIELGMANGLLEDPTLVFQATFSELPAERPYFRGVAMDRFDGHRWTSESPRTREPDWETPRADLVRIDVVLEAHPEGVLFAPGVVEGLDASGVAVDRDAMGAYHLPGPARRVEYTVFASPPFGVGRADPFRDAEPSLELPALDPRVRGLFEGVVGEATSADAKIAALSTWLQSDFAYTRLPRDLDAEAPLEQFLLELREGHCEYFASALAVGGRAVGVPTRVVAGFVGGDQGAGNTIVFRGYHAHAWVEYFDGDQWVTVDATPPIDVPTGPGWVQTVREQLDAFWTAGVVEYDAESQAAVARSIGQKVTPFAEAQQQGWAGAIVVALLAGLGLLGVRLWALGMIRRWEGGRPPSDPITSELDGAWSALEAAGRELPSGPDVEVARWLASQEPELGALMERLAWLSYEVRFGGGDVSSRMAEARALGLEIRAAAVVGGAQGS